MRLPYFPLMGLSCDEDESKPRKESCGKHEMTNMRVNEGRNHGIKSYDEQSA
jgi:hypothetical protein